jgi:hypothetical protein
MSVPEKELLAEIGKLQLFVWRTRKVRVLDVLSKDLTYEYQEILKRYDDHSNAKDVHLHVKGLLNTILVRLENDMKSLDRHFALYCTVHNGFITSVECNCGELTKYKVPLKLIDDFKCPKESSYEIKRRRIASRT